MIAEGYGPNNDASGRISLEGGLHFRYNAGHFFQENPVVATR